MLKEFEFQVLGLFKLTLIGYVEFQPFSESSYWMYVKIDALDGVVEAGKFKVISSVAKINFTYEGTKVKAVKWPCFGALYCKHYYHRKLLQMEF